MLTADTAYTIPSRTVMDISSSSEMTEILPLMESTFV
jgi:hypothetical protein